MKIKILALGLILAGACAADAAWAQTATVSPGSLITDGYEVKLITDISADEQKTMWPNDTVNPYIMITWQKGASVAVCAFSMVNWINLSDATLSNATLCKKH